MGIPSIRDRVVYTAAKLILEPIFEADFLESSYGFRPKRSAHEALAAIKGLVSKGNTAVYDADLKAYFDTIPHDKLLACVEMRVPYRSVLRLIRMWLKAPIQESSGSGNLPPGKHKEGTPQGGVISPLLANLYLHWLEKRFFAADGPAWFARAHIIRYADDFVILAKFIGPGLVRWIEDTVEVWLGLTINRDKTSIRNLRRDGESFDFLGYTLRYKTGLYDETKRYLSVELSAKACAREREALHELINAQRTYVPIAELLTRVNRQVKGWRTYFGRFHQGARFQGLNSFLCHRLVKHLKRRSQRPVRPPNGMTWYGFVYNHLGLIRL